MISGIFLQSLGFYGISFTNFFYELQAYGFFQYVLPFLIIFAVVFGIMVRLKLFGEGKAIYAIISIAVSLMALQFGFVSQFFSDIFPRLGIALAVILVIFIVFGIFNVNKKWNKGFMAMIGLFILYVILTQSFGSTWYTGYWLPYNWNIAAIVIAAVVIFAIVSIISNAEPKKEFKFPDAVRNIFSSDEYH